MKLYRKLVGYTNRGYYWSCSDFAHWVQETVGMVPKPKSATTEGWREWTEANKKSHPKWYWITEKGFGIAQDIVYFPHDVYMNFYYWFRSAYIVQPHVIRTGLEKGGWYDTDTRMRAGLFNLVVEFVEIEKGGRRGSSHRLSKNYIKENGRELGLSYLDWEIELGEGSPLQSKTAKEIKEIYLWIKDVRPNRQESYDITGWSEYCESKTDLFDSHDDDEERVKEMLDECHRIDKEYEDEDNHMLIRIINNRHGMWT